MAADTTENTLDLAALEQAVAMLEEDAVLHVPPGSVEERARMLATLRKIVSQKKDGTVEACPLSYAGLKQKSSDTMDVFKTAAVAEWLRDMGKKDDIGPVLDALNVLLHERNSDPTNEALIEAAENDVIEDAWDKRNLYLIAREYKSEKILPSKLVAELSAATNEIYDLWMKAKPANDWDVTVEPLQRLVDLAVQKAEIQSQALGIAPYDTVLKRFAPGNSMQLVDASFDELTTELPGMIQQIVAKQKGQSPVKKFHIDPKYAEQMSRELATLLQFDFNRGRLDMFEHCFAGGTKYDTRMTTAVNEEKGVFDCLKSLTHETGHANYFQGVPEAWENQPVGGTPDTCIHESQSIFLERQVGGSDAFLEFMYGFISSYDLDFAKQGTVKEFITSERVVTPSLIRIEADEVTYPLHPILRYDIEKMLFSKEVAVRDIPDVWNAKIKEYLNIDVPDNRRGCLQDVHWNCGYFGYFPGYTQGALFAADLFAAAKEDIQGLDDQIRRGDFKAVTQWSANKIHRHAAFYDSAELMQRATGRAPSAKPWLDAMKQRYL